MTQTKESLCRIDDHWCTECCEGMSCSNLEQLNDDSWGCLGHEINKEIQTETLNGQITVFPILEVCKGIDCLEGYDLDKQKVIATIKNQKSGEFVMSQILHLLGQPS